MDALYEAIVLVVLVSWIGFWEWRSAALMAISIPITLAMTFGTLYFLGIDIQQVSVATLIIALGLLVDDPVIAGDSIKRMLGEGHPNIIAAWLGPTQACYSDYVCHSHEYRGLSAVSDGERKHRRISIQSSDRDDVALLASRIASMTFLPLLGYYLLRPEKKPEKPLEERRNEGFYGILCARREVFH